MDARLRTEAAQGTLSEVCPQPCAYGSQHQQEEAGDHGFGRGGAPDGAFNASPRSNRQHHGQQQPARRLVAIGVVASPIRGKRQYGPMPEIQRVRNQTDESGHP